MVERWYRRFFGPDYWRLARHEYTPARTAAEVDYLADVLAALAPGRRVLDLGCGTGRHAVGLARRGFQVTGVDVSTWALAQAAAAAARTGARIELEQLDLLEDEWKLPEADAAVCVQAFGWGSDAEQARFLCRAWERLVPGGLLVLDHSNVNAILHDYRSEARFEADEAVYEFQRAYDPVSGRNRGELRVTRADGRAVVLDDDVRLYQPPEVAAMLDAAGFEVLRADADFVAGKPVEATTRYVQFVARRGPGATALAVDAHHSEQAGDALDLRSAPDEVAFVRDELAAAWARVARGGIEAARDYALPDPFGSARAAPSLAKHFGCRLVPAQVLTGAGTTGLLHALTLMVAPGRLLCSPLAHPDLPVWARRAGAAVRVAELHGDEDAAVASVHEAQPSLVLLERPDLLGRMAAQGAVRRLAAAAAACGAPLVVDEAAANYARPAASVVPLATELPNLLVLRSVSKGYCAGGLRAGFAVGTADTVARLRQVAPPLAVGALPLRAAVALLERGDALARLRRQVAEAHPPVARALAAAGLEILGEAPPGPWRVVAGGPEAEALLAEHNILAKRVVPLDGGRPLLKLAVPLSRERRRAFHRAFPDPGR